MSLLSIRCSDTSSGSEWQCSISHVGSDMCDDEGRKEVRKGEWATQLQTLEDETVFLCLAGYADISHRQLGWRLRPGVGQPSDSRCPVGDTGPTSAQTECCQHWQRGQLKKQ
ncbi:hypothetical protein EYF80_020635 [Liparis tanakae]|uniref:Uncharacterized protein n=1 Tax=Liparis tanakae TaxID=230148 RepID=A0A4Z2HTU4_9TELE|nr:hypothetical protein EYF80_020635 [Liparis tanakae]